MTAGMKAVVFDRTGGPEVLRATQLPVPRPGPGEVSIRVTATAMNFADLLQRQGNYTNHAGLHPVLGLECSGTVAEAGAGVTGWRTGDPVCALLNGGGYAEYAVARAEHLLPVPAGMDIRQAAALPEAACTVWSNMLDLAGLASGQRLLVHGGAGGVGSLAVQVGAAMGAEVFCTAGSAEKMAAVRGFGARHAIDYRNEDFVSVVRETTGGAGVDVILDVLGASYLTRNLEALAPDGRIAMIGLQGGREAQVNLGAMMKKRATLFTTSLRDRPPPAKARIVRGVAADLWPLVEAGRIAPVVDRAFPLDRIVDAHRFMEGGSHIGKILVDVRD